MIQAKNEYPARRANHTMVPYENGIFFFHGADETEELADTFYLNLGNILLFSRKITSK